MRGTLYVVATPIGNLGDVSPRARDVLGAVAAVACEDTRRARVLLDHLGLRTPLLAMPAPREDERAPALVARLLAGEDLALISDAGTPGLSDPGNRLLSACARAGVRAVPVPGPSALAALVSVCPLPTDRFQFVGFPPKKGRARREWLDALRTYGGTSFFYCNGREVDEVLGELAPEPGLAQVVLGRELTKLHEEVATGDAATTRPSDARGELVVALRMAPAAHAGPDDARLTTAAHALAGHGLAASEIARLLADLAGLPRKQAYPIAQAAVDATDARAGDDDEPGEEDAP